MWESKIAFVAVDRTGVILLWGGDAENLTGHPASHAVGNTLDIIVPPEYQDRHWNGFRRAMDAGVAEAEGAPINLPVQCRDGETRRLPTRFTLVREVGGHTIGAVACISEPSPTDPTLFDL